MSMKQWLHVWRTRPRLNRRQKTMRNFLLCVPILVLLWGVWGYPLPTAELEFRRLERENLLGRSEIQGIFKGNYNDRTVFGTQGDQVLIGYHNGRSLESWPREESGPTLLSVSEYNPFGDTLLFAAADPPESTASARLDMTIDCWFATTRDGGTSISAVEGGYPQDNSLDWNRWERDYQAEGELLKEGGVLFRVPRGDAEDTVSIERDLFWMLTRQNTFLYQTSAVRGGNCRMEAVFYDEAGRELGRAALATLEDGDSAAG